MVLSILIKMEEKTAQCPYCWEMQYFEIDPSIAEQEYVEDCQICCHPILIRVTVGIEDIGIQTAKESDGF